MANTRHKIISADIEKDIIKLLISHTSARTYVTWYCGIPLILPYF